MLAVMTVAVKVDVAAAAAAAVAAVGMLATILVLLVASLLDTIFSGKNGRSIKRCAFMDSSLNVASGNLTFNQLT